jgi:predicted dehydrogenase
VAVLGAGYWGPNLIRNFTASGDFDVRWVCDLSLDRARRAVGRYSTVRVTDELASVLDDESVQAVAIATPASTHAEVALAAIDAGKHVLIEKPLATSVSEGEKIIAAASARNRVVMLDHTYCYTPSVRRIRELVESGALGQIQYLDSVRINLGLIQRDIDVIWDLAPHDLSILDFILPPDQRPESVAAFGADPVGAGQSCVAYLTLPLPGDAIAHVHVNWLSPTKIRQMIVGGSQRMVVWDDLHPTQRLSVFDKGVNLTRPEDAGADAAARVERLVSYRVGEMVAPALPEGEALRGVVTEFARAIREDGLPLTDGASGLRVLRQLEAAAMSHAQGGGMVSLSPRMED